MSNRYSRFVVSLLVCVLTTFGLSVRGEERIRVEPSVQAMFESHCFDCHGNGEAEGGLALDALMEAPVSNERRGQWHRVLKNIRAAVMPPSESEPLSGADQRSLARWVGREALGLDPDRPDPGRVTLRRLNRIEYRNTILDLTGVDFPAEVEFPPDDSGFGFDNIGDVLSLSPLLMEKYLAAAEQIIDQAVPKVSRVPRVQTLSAESMQYADWSPRQVTRAEAASRQDHEAVDQHSGSRTFDGDLTLYRPQTLTATFRVSRSARYRLRINATVDGGFGFDPGRAEVQIRLNDQTLQNSEYAWASDQPASLVTEIDLVAGEHVLAFRVTPLVAESERREHLDYQLKSVQVEGPLDRNDWVPPPGYSRFFSRDAAPTERQPRLDYAAEVLTRFAERSFRRPASPNLISRLVGFVEPDLLNPDISFEQAVSSGFVAILSSPGFLFRNEVSVPNETEATVQMGVVRIDQHALASRLSYFLWSTMPDAELSDTASQGNLESQIHQQVDRMLDDPRSDQLASHFVGQWLRTRDVVTQPIDPLGASGQRERYERLRDQRRTVFRQRNRLQAIHDQWKKQPSDVRKPQVVMDDGERFLIDEDFDPHEVKEAFVREIQLELRPLYQLRDSINPPLRSDFRKQTERLFSHVFRNDRPLLELLSNDYEFLNERLAKYYGIDGIQGDQLRRVSLPAGSRRGGLLRQPGFLIVTSNPTRTSPVKRGLFILDNILGTPSPPAPAAVPELEEAAEQIRDENPSLRTVLQRHRSEPLCQSCHQRFDPLGLALENYNALGQWREQDNGQPIEPAGVLITGESFQDADSLVSVLIGPRRDDFYRCLTEKLLTYALGRGLEYYDETAIDRIVDELRSRGDQATLRQLIHSVVSSVPFQYSRVSNRQPLADRSIHPIDAQLITSGKEE
ncbi:MAG: DUF1592 domain-containing protein [Planctomycetota bacterium]